MRGFDLDELEAQHRKGRYDDRSVEVLVAEDGRQTPYLRRSFLRPAFDTQLFIEVTVAEGDRLDLLALRHLGDAHLAWRIVEANEGMKPEDLVATPGATLRIPAGGPGGSP